MLALVLFASLAVFLSPFQARAQTQAFSEWLEQLRIEALQRGISKTTVDRALTGITPLERVIKADRNQPEFTQTFWRYLDSRVSDKRVARARELLRKHKALLDRVYARYGVQPRFLVAFWALETNFGEFTGKIPLVQALASLAYDPRRGPRFRTELFAALELMDRGDIPVVARGSWAGALGQCQFMPVNYKNYAVDFDGDGLRDLWKSLPDIFASAANFLSAMGWDGSKTWGREVRLPVNFDLDPTGLGFSKPLGDWQALGVRRMDGRDLPAVDIAGSVLLPAGHKGPAFLVYRNFRKTMGWNPSILYALSVGHLADRIAGHGRLTAKRPAKEERLLREQVVEIQQLLLARGHDLGTADGVVGPLTRKAIKAFQKTMRMPADGYPTPALLASLQKVSGMQ